MAPNANFETIARQAMLEKGFIPDFSEAISEELKHLDSPAPPTLSVRDLRGLMWVSIDNETSEDLDQLTYAEPGVIFIAVADVDALVKKGSAIDTRAAHNTTSIYTPAIIFPMLPLKLSTNLTSLNENTDRCAIVIEVQVEKEGRFDLKDLYPALVRNHAKLTYPCVGAWLDDRSCTRPIPPLPGLPQQLALQDQIAQKIQYFREKKGALEFGVIQIKAALDHGIPISIEQQDKNRAHKLIENYMIAANVAVIRYLKQHHLPSIRRVVQIPKRWSRIVALAKEKGKDLPPVPDPVALKQFLLDQKQADPVRFPDLSLAVIKLLGRGEYVVNLPGKPSSGHFDLAEPDYCHATAPNRRFPDLIMQRLLKSRLFNTPPPYTPQELSAAAQRCTEKETDADKIERRLIKCAAASILQKEIGKTFDAMVTGSAPKGTWVRLVDPPIEGKLVKGFEKVDVGDFLKVKLIRTDIVKGHIDFANLLRK